MKRWLIALLILGAAGGGSYALWRYLQGSSEPLYRFETGTVDRGSVVSRVTATGTLSALVTVQVGSQVSGRLKKIYVDYNSPVRKGQLIAKIDPALFQAAVQQARANVAAAQGQLAVAQVRAMDAARQYERLKLLVPKKLIAPADLDTADANARATAAQVTANLGQVAQAKAQLHQARINLEYTRIVSPTNGVVISRSVDVGQTVAASLQAPTLFLIAEDLQKMQVDTNVAEADVGKLRAGMAATFTVDAFPNERFQGVVRQIRNAPQTLQNVVTYDAVLDVKNPELKLRPGMTANVTFVWAERHDVLRVPNAALRFRPPRELRPPSTKGAAATGATGAGGGSGALAGAKTGRGGQGASAAHPATAAKGGAMAAGARDGGVAIARKSRFASDGGITSKERKRPSAGSAGSRGAAGVAGSAGAGPRKERAPRAPDERSLWVLENGALREVPVRIGITDGSLTELKSGAVSPGEKVVTEAAKAKKGGKPARAGGVGRML